MNIAIDYDGTYTADPETFDRIIAEFQKAGHEVICVTMRYNDESENYEVQRDMKKNNVRVVYTGRRAKKSYMVNINVWIDIWIEDNPYWILNNAADFLDGQSS
jgi:hydroxymethylpyrimidine pyrophosphatase-like HAD family hydrolase